MNKNEWKLKFKVVDKNKRKAHKKAVLVNIDVEFPTEMANYIFAYVLNEVRSLSQ